MRPKQSVVAWRNTVIILFFFVQFHTVEAQNDSIIPFDHRGWISMGPVLGSSFPNLSFKDSRSLYGGEMSFTYERKNQVLYLKGYAIIDFYKFQLAEYNPMPDKLSFLSDLSLSYGYRFNFKYGCLIPSIGISWGHMNYRGNHTDTTQAPDLTGLGFDPVYNFNHHQFFYMGFPITVRWLRFYKYLGIELGAYCNIHQYADIGFTAALAMGNITDYRRRKRG